MPYAFLVLAHEDPIQLAELVKALDHPDFSIYIHLDKKADMRRFRQAETAVKASRVEFIEDRFDIRWGDISMVRATIALYAHAVKSGSFERVTLLSGLDFPLVSPDQIIRSFEHYKDTELIMGSPVAPEFPEKVTNYNFLSVGNKYLRVLLRGTIGRFPLKRSDVTIDGERRPVYFAPQWQSLTGECVKSVLLCLDRNPNLWRYFGSSYAPDELLIPTIVFNSSFGPKTLQSNFPVGTHYNYKCAIHYINYEPIVQVLTECDYAALKQSGKLFCRKVRTGQSDALREMLVTSAGERTVGFSGSSDSTLRSEEIT